MYFDELISTTFEVGNDNKKSELAMSTKTVTNINDMRVIDFDTFIYRPGPRCVLRAEEFFKDLWTKQYLNKLINRPVHIQFAAKIEYYKLYEVFQEESFVYHEPNIHDYSIRGFQKLCLEKQMPFSNVVWEEDLLYFIWEINETVIFNSKQHLFGVFREFLELIDSIGIEDLVFSPMYTSIKSKQFSSIMWNSSYISQYKHKYQHRIQKLDGDGFIYVDSDGSIVDLTN